MFIILLNYFNNSVEYVLLLLLFILQMRKLRSLWGSELHSLAHTVGTVLRAQSGFRNMNPWNGFLQAQALSDTFWKVILIKPIDGKGSKSLLWPYFLNKKLRHTVSQSYTHSSHSVTARGEEGSCLKSKLSWKPWEVW